MNASVFVTCLGDTFYPHAVRAAVKVLERMGVTVACPPGQTCCGQPMFNAGYFDQALSVARRFVKVFQDTQGFIVTPSSSCAAMVRHFYPRLFREDAEGLKAAQAVGERTFEFCEFLVKHLKVDLTGRGARFEDSVTFHYSCHFRPLGIKEEPINLIRQIAGLEYFPLKKIDNCCGFGGTFSLNFPHVSGAMAADKVQCIKETGADWLVFADAGCAMNITGYANRAGTPVKAMHIAELIEKALGGGR
jgi:L-lactate dehydrogenase complex protein LldE